MKKNYQTQWAGQYGVAHELTLRGYMVAFTTGNAPAVDLLCQSPAGVSFSVQVKSLASKNYFLYQTSLLTPNSTRFFVFVLLPSSPFLPTEYFVVNHEQFLGVVDEQELILKAQERKRGKPYADFAPGIHYRTLAGHEFRDAWSNMPA